jgi:hypothetical protein
VRTVARRGRQLDGDHAASSDGVPAGAASGDGAASSDASGDAPTPDRDTER